MTVLMTGCMTILPSPEPSKTVETTKAAETTTTAEQTEPSTSEQAEAGSNASFDNGLVAGTSWMAPDNSCMMFFDESEYAWYQDKTKTDDNYYAGGYRFYIGEDALEYITVDLEEYGVTREEMLAIIENSELYTLDTFVCMTADNTSFMLDGEEKLADPESISYFGFILEDGTYLYVANMNTGNYYEFIKE